ncbi:uncharacterized protein [Hemitrygon akajei]|uniref:uncharacterized protein isoform X3 n=1 Tax=Hemitrygon akajei TaxID=2704970 RepID=UPI003BF98560
MEQENGPGPAGDSEESGPGSAGDSEESGPGSGSFLNTTKQTRGNLQMLEIQATHTKCWWNTAGQAASRRRSTVDVSGRDPSSGLTERKDSEFPDRLIILNMSGNDCTKQEEYREQVIQTLPVLQQLDGILVQRKKDPNEAGEIHDSDGSENEEDSDELDDTEVEKNDSLPNIFTSPEKIKDFFAELHKEMVCRSQQRRKEAEKEHKNRLNELQEIRKQLTQMQYEPIKMNKLSNYPRNDPNFNLREDGQNEEHAAQADTLD